MTTPKPSKARLLSVFIYVLIFPVLLLYVAGNWFWIQGWIFSIWLVVLCYSVFLYMYFYDPELLMERYKKPGSEGEKGWDKYYMYFLSIIFMAWFFIMPLDAQRYAWSPDFPIYLEILGLVFLVVCFILFLKSYVDNTYLSPLVRIQSERDQKVVSTGVYGWVRHPLYLGAIFMFLGGPLIMGSLYGLILGLILSFSLIFRIIGEEEMLLEELDGYEDYKKKVKYRLIPYIW